MKLEQDLLLEIQRLNVSVSGPPHAHAPDLEEETGTCSQISSYRSPVASVCSKHTRALTFETLCQRAKRGKASWKTA